MSTLTKLSPNDVAERVKSGDATLIDIREADERRRDHIAGALSLPLSALEQSHSKIEPGRQAIFHCRTGMRTETNCDRLAAIVDGEAFVLEGGLEAWKAAGLPTQKDAKAPLEVQRQVQITAGSLVLAGAALGAFAHPAFYALSAFIGAGLVFAGVSGSCTMAKVLGAMPWNRSPAA